MVALPHKLRQVPLIHCVESDDLFLHDQVDVVWFDVLNSLDYHAFQTTAAHYYEQLFTFNQQQKQRRIERRESPPPPNPESQIQASQRTLLERTTLDPQAPPLYHRPAPADPLIRIAPRELVPGVPPPRFVGRPPKCFFAMLYSFLGTTLAGQPAEPEFVHQRLRENPAFARTCGFTVPRPGKPARQSDIPSLQMKVIDLPETDEARRATEDLTVTEDLLSTEDNPRVVKLNGPPVTVGRVAVARVPIDQIGKPPASSPVAAVTANRMSDTGKTGHRPCQTTVSRTNTKSGNSKSGNNSPPRIKPTRGQKSKTAKPKRKSHPRVTKNCRCEDREHCDHAWVNADEGAGTVVKSTGKMYWGHKASTLSFADQEVLLDAVAMSDAASHDSKSLLPHLNRLFARHPDLRGFISRVLDDGAADDPQLKAAVREQFGLELLAPINPRRRGALRTDLPRGIDHLTPRGVPVCVAGYPFELLGFRQSTERFIFAAPEDSSGVSVCQGCARREGCYRGASGGRVATIAADRLPWIDRELPQLSKRFGKAMSRRTSIERLQKLMKFDLGDDRLTKRGNDAFQARLDKTLFAMHVLLSQER